MRNRLPPLHILPALSSPLPSVLQGKPRCATTRSSAHRRLSPASCPLMRLLPCPTSAVQYKPKRAAPRSSAHRQLTQAELLAEAAKTELENTKSLQAS